MDRAVGQAGGSRREGRQGASGPFQLVNDGGPPPSSPEAELAVLAAMVLDAEAADRARDVLRLEDFADAPNAQIFAAILRLRARGDPVDAITLFEELRTAGELETAGGAPALARLLDQVPDAGGVAVHARIIREHADRRRLAAGADRLARLARTGGDIATLSAAIAQLAPVLEQEGRRARTLAELLEDPDALRPPVPIAPRLAWSGAVTVLAAREKRGKSTFAAAAAAAVSAGSWWLGEPTSATRVLWIAPEEALAHVVQRFQDAGAAPEALWLLDRVADPVEDLTREVERVGPELVVVDTLASWAGPAAPESGDARGWTALLLPVVHLARDSGAAFVLLHHAGKADGSYRDSTAIGALADVLAEMQEGERDGEREIRVRARWPVDDYAVRLVEGGRFELAAGELSLDLRCVMAIEREPGISRSEVARRVTGKRAAIFAELDRLLKRGAIEDRGSGNRSALFPSEPAGNLAGTGREPIGEPVTAGGSVPGGTPLQGVCPPGEPVSPSAGRNTDDELAADLDAALDGGEP